MFLLLGILLGVVVSVGEGSSPKVFYTSSLSLYDIITNDYIKGELFLSSLAPLLLATIIIFVLSIKRISFFLTFVYIAFQGFLFSQSLVAIILANGIEGVLTALFFIIPINILNFASLISFLVVCWHRLSFASSYSLGTKKSLKTFTKKYMLVLALCVVSSLIYGFIYPLLLRSVVVINY